ncbi:MAG: LysE family transporter [Thalassotalea sp.]
MVNSISYWQEFLLVAVLHFFAVASPGPDFSYILKQTINHGRKIALYASGGIALGILFHVTLSLLGLGVIIQSSAIVFTALKLFAIGYFLYVGVKSLTSKAVTKREVLSAKQSTTSVWQAFATGFLINGLNVKATLFFISLFTMMISIETPLMVKGFYGIYLAVATWFWFSLLSFILTITAVRNKLATYGFWLERILGVSLIFVAINIALFGLN